MSLAIQGSRLVATRTRRTIPMPPRQRYIDSVETLVTNSVFQKVVTTDVLVEWAMVQNISERPITLRKLEDDPTVGTLGEGAVLSKADSDGQGGGIMVLPKVDINLWFWATTTAGDKMYVVRLN